MLGGRHARWPSAGSGFFRRHAIRAPAARQPHLESRMPGSWRWSRCSCSAVCASPAPRGALALCLTIQGFLFLLDVAIAPLMLRDVARAQAVGQGPASYQRFLRLYGGVAALVFVVGEAAVLFAAGIESMPADLRYALQLALVQFLFQFSNNAAIGYWNGVQQQRYANRRLIAFTFTKHLLALILVWRWHTASHTCCRLRWSARSSLREPSPLRAEHAGLLSMPAQGDWRDIGGYAAATALGLAAASRSLVSWPDPAGRSLWHLPPGRQPNAVNVQRRFRSAARSAHGTAAQPFAVARSMRRLLIVLIVRRVWCWPRSHRPL